MTKSKNAWGGLKKKVETGAFSTGLVSTADKKRALEEKMRRLKEKEDKEQQKQEHEERKRADKVEASAAKERVINERRSRGNVRGTCVMSGDEVRDDMHLEEEPTEMPGNHSMSLIAHEGYHAYFSMHDASVKARVM